MMFLRDKFLSGSDTRWSSSQNRNRRGPGRRLRVEEPPQVLSLSFTCSRTHSATRSIGLLGARPAVVSMKRVA